jgi:uncharacterized protein YbjT (DUF2867 family)
MQFKTLTIVGGSGFVGSHLINRLTKENYRVRVLTRQRERHRHLLVIPTLELLEGDPHAPQVLTRHLAGSDAVINLVGILNERGDDGSGFQAAHVELPCKIVEACKTNGIGRLLHMSALNADAREGPSHYLKTKGEGENRVHEAAKEGLHVTSFRPSVIFGPGDGLFNRFALLLKIAPFFFPLACPRARFAPIYVGDVVEAFRRSLNDSATHGRRYDLCGPHEYTLIDLVEYTAKQLGLKRRIIPLNDKWSLTQAQLLERFPGKPFSLDNYRSLQVDSICKGENGLAALGITPTSIEATVPGYLGKQSQRARYSLFRRLARRR